MRQSGDDAAPAKAQRVRHDKRGKDCGEPIRSLRGIHDCSKERAAQQRIGKSWPAMGHLQRSNRLWKQRCPSGRF